jgi:hypothetical protein
MKLNLLKILKKSAILLELSERHNHVPFSGIIQVAHGSGEYVDPDLAPVLRQYPGQMQNAFHDLSGCPCWVHLQACSIFGNA